MSEVQLSMFPALVPDVEVRHMSRGTGSLSITLAGDGWVLVRSRGGPQGWHLVKAWIAEGGLITVCGVKGSPLAVDLPFLVRCESCEALVAAT